ncbi:MAG: metalloregulator ArsR/SmtB family transcription factor [Gemmatimonadota bacterium]
MVTYNREAIFHALADSRRREILDLLRGGECPAGSIAGRFSVTRPAISRHLRVLRDAGLVLCRKDAQARLYRLNAEAFHELDRWLERYRIYWAARLQDLKRFVEEGP